MGPGSTNPPLIGGLYTHDQDSPSSRMTIPFIVAEKVHVIPGKTNIYPLKKKIVGRFFEPFEMVSF